MSKRTPHGPGYLECPVCLTADHLRRIPEVLDEAYECRKCGSRAYNDEEFNSDHPYSWMKADPKPKPKKS